MGTVFHWHSVVKIPLLLSSPYSPVGGGASPEDVAACQSTVVATFTNTADNKIIIKISLYSTLNQKAINCCCMDNSNVVVCFP